MDQIRPFQNADLPDIAAIWIRHWAAVTQPPEVSVAMIEQAILARTFFDAADLLVARRDNSTVGWCQIVPDPGDDKAIIPAICFSPEGLQLCDGLLREAETRVQTLGLRCIEVGPHRDTYCGYAGLDPVGHGIGIPTIDARTSSLLSRRGYSTGINVSRMTATTSTFRPAVNRDWLQLRRTTRLDRQSRTPKQSRTASAMAHFDIEHHRLIDHRSTKELATIDIWISDPEAQVMSCSKAIFDLSEIHQRGEITVEEGFLISSLIQSLANRRVFSVETAIDCSQTRLMEQLEALGLVDSERGNRWIKTL